MIDHIIYTSPNLNSGVRTFASEYGIEPSAGERHPGFGTRNALIGLGAGRYVEILAIDETQDVPPSGRFLRLQCGSPSRFSAWCARADRPLEETVHIGRSAGYDLGEVVTMSRQRPDGTTISWKLTAPPRAEGVLPFYIDWGDTPNPATLLPPLLTLACFTLTHPEPARIRAIFAALGEDEVEVRAGPKPELQVKLQRRSS